ncbi:hypothetical protein MMC15_007712 [Xylographa vitiligo]|nr:hypothetical protein [Xylographa vitiligo]
MAESPAGPINAKRANSRAKIKYCNMLALCELHFMGIEPDVRHGWVGSHLKKFWPAYYVSGLEMSAFHSGQIEALGGAAVSTVTMSEAFVDQFPGLVAPCVPGAIYQENSQEQTMIKTLKEVFSITTKRR